MGLASQFSIRSLQPTQSGDVKFFTPQTSNETMLVEVPPGTNEDLFVHHFQTDQLSVVQGSLILVVLQNRKYHYILLSDRRPAVLTIPPRIPHGVINLASKPCLVINALLRHGALYERDYQPIKPPFPYDLRKVRQKLLELEIPAGV